MMGTYVCRVGATDVYALCGVHMGGQGQRQPAWMAHEAYARMLPETWVDEVAGKAHHVSEYDPSAHVSLYFSRRCEPTTLAKIPVQEHRLDAYELSEMVSGWKGPIDFEIHSKDLPSSIDAVVAAEQVLNLGLPGTLDAVNNVNWQGFPYEDLRIRRARSVRSWNMPGDVADRRTKKEQQSPGASSRTSKSSLTRVENLTGHVFSFKKMVPDGGEADRSSTPSSMPSLVSMLESET
ncbi:hypothetical protein B0H11DRAFT_2257576 [Mycena galericulata]|nr:hypothetical protein B0H11DRAFT_2257576 [Mycena galericulata]